MPQFNFEAIGTKWQIDLYNPLAKEGETALLSAVKNRIDIFDKAYSRFRKDSLVTRMSQEIGTFTLPDDAEPMMQIYRDLYFLTNGLVTPLIGNLISDAGYDANYSLEQKKKLEASPAWDDVIEYHHPQLTVKKPVLLDFGAAGKGYLIDIVGKVLEENGVTAFCIDAGGDILYKNSASTEPIRIALENPANAEEAIGICNLKNASICGSAGNRRVWGDFTHIINPKTLVSPKNILAVWVTAETALVADAIATCLFFVSASALLSAYTFEYIVIHEGGVIEKSEHFPGELFT